MMMAAGIPGQTGFDVARIDFPDGTNPFLPLLPRRNDEDKKTGRQGKTKGLFRSKLVEALDEAKGSTESGISARLSGEAFSDGAIEGLLDAVHEAGDKLKDDLGLESIKAYKKAVRDFIHQVVERSYSVERQTGGTILNRKEYLSITLVDESLERLAAEILRSQRDRLEILRRIDEINGMLIDFIQ